MSDLTLFDMDAPAWVPVFEKSYEDYGWTAAPNGMPIKADGEPATKAEWKAYLADGRCRDCGVTCAFDRGGAGDGKSYRICNGCAQLDGARIVEHRAARCEPRPGMPGTFEHWTTVADCLDCGWDHWSERFRAEGSMEREPVPDEVIDAAIAHHCRARWSSHWGESHELSEHDGLVKAQARRRAAYLAAVAA